MSYVEAGLLNLIINSMRAWIFSRDYHCVTNISRKAIYKVVLNEGMEGQRKEGKGMKKGYMEEKEE